MLMFLSQLTGPDIGLSACNIIIITRHTLLTVSALNTNTAYIANKLPTFTSTKRQELDELLI